MRALLWQTECGLITPAIYPDTFLLMRLSHSGLQSGFYDCLVDPLLIFLVDLFYSGPGPVCISLTGAISPGPRSTYTAASLSEALKL
ncbi:unnamed protein product [Protopolystoma xenopodis]|uniref:Uncharacterized protein n=1 Tax=Protopolystoma xenopodis TaxID=117903 RepID=A0A448WWW6_9PLAT|nr:unnamed protein product [Protopolystoma xenopodis]